MSERLVNVSHTGDNPELVYKGITYRSKLELYTAQALDAMGLPFAYEQRKIVLLDGFRTPFQKKKVIALTYTPDFEIGPVMLECKGFETPEWKIKKKLLFKYLMENEPETIFHQTHDATKSLLLALDTHWTYLGYAIQVTPKPSNRKSSSSLPTIPILFDSIQQALSLLPNLKNKAIGPILSSLTGKKEYVYGYNWKLKQITI